MALAVGTVAPDFTTIDDEGKTVSLSDYKGKVVVLYFYPKDDTPGCTKEAQSFRDNYQQYQDKEMVVFGVSMGAIRSFLKSLLGMKLRFSY